MSDSQSNNKTLVIILGVLSAVLAGVTIYLFTQLSAAETSIVELDKLNEEKQSEADELVSELEVKKQEYADLIVKHEELGLDVEDLQLQYESLSDEIDSYKSELRKKDANIRGLKEKMRDASAIHRLEIKNKQKEIEFLMTENDSLSTTSQELDRNFKAQSEVLKRKNEKIVLASVLRAENITVYTKDVKQKKQEKQPFKAKKIDYMVIEFNIADNQVSPYNKKTLAMRLVAPDGTVLYDLASGGGSMKTASRETVFYTMKQNLLFDNSKQKLVFPYQKQGEWEPGEYTAQIYGDGYLIGKVTFSTK